MDYLLDIGISVVLSALKQAIKNPTKKEQLRKAMLKIYTQIGIVYSADDSFSDSAIKAHGLYR